MASRSASGAVLWVLSGAMPCGRGAVRTHTQEKPWWRGGRNLMAYAVLQQSNRQVCTVDVWADQMDRQKKLLIFGLAWLSAGLLTWFLYTKTVAPQQDKKVQVVVAA